MADATSDAVVKRRITTLEAELAAGPTADREEVIEAELATLYKTAHSRDRATLTGTRAKAGKTGAPGKAAKAKTTTTKAPAGATRRPSLAAGAKGRAPRGASSPPARRTYGKSRGRGARSGVRQVYRQAEPYGVSGWGSFFWRATGTAVGLSLLLLLLRNAEGKTGGTPIVQTVAGGFATGLTRLMDPSTDVFGSPKANAKTLGRSTSAPAGPAGPAGVLPTSTRPVSPRLPSAVAIHAQGTP